MLDEKQDADLQSDEQENDLVVEVEEPKSSDSDQDQEEDPSDKLNEDHPRFKDVINERNQARQDKEDLQKELQDLKDSISQRKENTGDDELTQEEQASLEKIERNLTKRGFVRQEDLKVQENANKLSKLTDKYTGTDGLPKFEGADVVAYAKKNGFGDNYEAAYKDMHFDAIVDNAAKKNGQAPKAPSAEKPSAGAEETGTKKRFTEADIEKMSPEEYERYRGGLMTAIKPK